MTEFDEYLKLGNELESENKILMACAAYLEAIKKGTEEQGQTIKSYIKLLVAKVDNDISKRNQQVKQQLLEWKEQGNALYAIRCYDNIYNNMDGVNWIDSDNAILYRCFIIYYLEEKYSVVTLDIREKGIEELKKWYYSLKFMVRRVDMDIYEEQEIVEYVKKEKISMMALHYMCSTMCFHSDRTYKNFMKLFVKYSMKDYGAFFEGFCKEKSEKESEVVKKDLYDDIGEIKEKIAFIIAVNEEEMYREALYYIEHLKVPTGVKIEVIPVRGASSAASAYNRGMKLTDAKYKVYMHQDIMIVNPYMIYEMMNIFKDEEIGLIGVAGAMRLPEGGVWWEDPDRYMRIYQDILIHSELSDTGNLNGDYAIAEAVDGVFMATQYDIPWREDIFNGWHFYDISQSMEFNRRNLKVVVAAQREVWCLHEQKANKEFWADYEKEKEKFFKEYKSEKE